MFELQDSAGLHRNVRVRAGREQVGLVDIEAIAPGLIGLAGTDRGPAGDNGNRGRSQEFKELAQKLGKLLDEL